MLSMRIPLASLDGLRRASSSWLLPASDAASFAASSSRSLAASASAAASLATTSFSASSDSPPPPPPPPAAARRPRPARGRPGACPLRLRLAQQAAGARAPNMVKARRQERKRVAPTVPARAVDSVVAGILPYASRTRYSCTVCTRLHKSVPGTGHSTPSSVAVSAHKCA